MPEMVSERPPKAKTAASAAMIPKEMAPWPTSSPIAKAPNMTAPRNKQNTGMNQRLRIVMEHLFNGRLEVSGERDRQRQRGRVALLFDRVDRLARDVHGLGELLLGQPVGLAQGSHLVVHQRQSARASLRTAASSSVGYASTSTTAVRRPRVNAFV